MTKTEQVVENKPKTQYLGKIVALLVLAVVSFTAYTAGAKNVAASAMRFNSQGDGPPACVETCAYTCMETNYYSLAAACPCFQQCDISSCSVEDTKFVVGFVTGGCQEHEDDARDHHDDDRANNNDNRHDNVKPVYAPATATGSDVAYCDNSGCCTSDPAGVFCVTQNPTAKACYPVDQPCTGSGVATTDVYTATGATIEGINAYCDDSGCCTSDPAGVFCVTQNPTAKACYPLDQPCSGYTGGTPPTGLSGGFGMGR